MATLLPGIGPLSIFIYALSVTLSLMAGLAFARHEARRSGVEQSRIMDLCLYILVAAILGARLTYAILNPDPFLNDPLEIFKIRKGGVVIGGGLLFALATGIIYLKKENLPFWKTADILALPLVSGYFINRLGCFFAGCCFGASYESPWTVSIFRSNSIIMKGAPLQPSHLYAALNSLLIMGALMVLRRRKKFDGQIFWFCVLLYGIAQSLTEIFYIGTRGHFVYGIVSQSQLMGGLMATIAIVMLIYLGKKPRGGDH
jgi:phosphatidylglycerol:prolipoprotein diacylglycerol transferase